MENEIGIAVIGGGVIGCAVAWHLSLRHEGIFLFEKNPGVTQGENQSSRNSGVVHSGIYYDQETRPLKAALCVKGNHMLYDFCEQYRVPALKTGKLLVASSPQEEEVLEFYLDRARQNNVPGVEIISSSKVKNLEPNTRSKAALLVPSAGIVEPTSLVYRLHVLASQKGVEFMAGTEVTGLNAGDDFILLDIRYPDGQRDQIRAGVVVNAGGIYADQLARMVSPDSPYELDPIRGEAYKFYGHKRPELALTGMNVYPTPISVTTPSGTHFTVGVHLTPTFEDLSYPPRLGTTVTVGPKLVPAKDREDWAGPTVSADFFADAVRSFFPGIGAEDLLWHQAGLQARLKKFPDFIVSVDSTHPNFVSLLGIDSPGLTSCLAVAERAVKMVEEIL